MMIKNLPISTTLGGIIVIGFLAICAVVFIYEFTLDTIKCIKRKYGKNR